MKQTKKQIRLFENSQVNDVIEVICPYDKALTSTLYLEIFNNTFKAIVVLTDDRDLNHGKSVTNGNEFVADYVKDNYLPDMNDKDIIWIETYTHNSDYVQVFMDKVNGKYCNPKWKYLKNKEQILMELMELMDS